MVVVSAPCPPQASRRGRCADVEPQARQDIKLEGQHPAALPWAAAPGSLHPGGKLDVIGGIAGIELVVPIKVPQGLGARIPNGAVKEKKVHSLVVPGDGKMMHLGPGAKPFPVEGGREVGVIGAAAAPHGVQKQRGVGRLGHIEFSPIPGGRP